jgi:transcriptional regulator GlxA family with amidase domain
VCNGFGKKGETGNSIKSYVLRRRLQKTEHLLLNTGMEIKEIGVPSYTNRILGVARALKAHFGEHLVVTAKQGTRRDNFDFSCVAGNERSL